MHDRDTLRRFLFEHYPIRGHLVHLDTSWRALLEHHDYPRVIRDTLGEALGASVLLAATLKFDGNLSLQLRGKGPMHLMLAQCSSELAIRGVARYREAVESPDLAALAGEGTLTVTLENEDLSQRYQGIVPLGHASLAECLQVYFETSEQLPTRLWLHSDGATVAGLLLQRLPADSVFKRPGAAPESIERSFDVAAVDDAWRRVQLLGDTLTAAELRALADQQILRRLFAEDDVRMFESAPVYFRCRCSRERVSSMLQSLGEAEIRSVLAEQGQVEVRCDFCNRAYLFDAVDVERLFKESAAGAGSKRVH
jgi:molecular chaperone Hsp33